MNPTEEQLKNRELALQNINQGLPQNTGVITTDSLSPSTPLNVPPSSSPTDLGPTIDSNLETLLAAFNAPSKEETTSNDLQTQILESLGTLGTEKTRQAELEKEAGLGGQRTELQNVINQLQTLSKQRAAIPLEIQQESEGRARTATGVAPIETARTRENTIKALGLAAIGQTLQGNIALAESNIQSALDAEFEPERTKLATLQQLYVFNKDTLERVDKKRADALNIFLDERSRLLGIAEADKKEIYDIGKTALNYGADSGTVQKIYASKTREDALLAAGSFLQDPMAKIDLENAKLGNILTRTQIEKAAYELDLLKKYGGMTPAQYAQYLKDEQKSIRDEEDAQVKSDMEGQALNEKITVINSILNSSGVNSVVGTNVLTRGKTTTVLGATLLGGAAGLPFGPIGVAGGALLGGGAALLTGNLDQITGSGQFVIGRTEQLISKEFLDNLIAVKAKGATFGALTDREGAALRAAATYIGNRQIRDKNDNVVGYNMAEADFKRELNNILTLTQKAYEKATGNVFTGDEQDVLDQLYGGSTLLSPQGYYQQ